MRLPVVVFLVTTHGILRGSHAGLGRLNVTNNILFDKSGGCDQDVTDDYRRTLYDFATRLYKKAATDDSYNFVLSPKLIWITVAAIAEGAECEAQQQLFKALNLPEEKCIRLKYYHLALNNAPTGFNVTLDKRAAIYVDEGLEINPEWEQFVCCQGFLDIISSPIKKDPQDVAKQLRRYISAKIPEPNLSGNSILLNSLSYEALWTYSDACVESSPFYNDFGEEVGTVEFLKIKKHVKLAHLPLLSSKALSMPVGIDNRYVMIYIVALGKNKISTTVELFKNTIILEILECLKESSIPLEVAIPRATVSSELDVRRILEEMGISNIWSDPAATSKISEPAALPSSYVHRVTVKLDSTRVDPPEYEANANQTDLATGLDTALGRDFLANRPFMYGLFDTNTMTCILAGVYYCPK